MSLFVKNIIHHKLYLLPKEIDRKTDELLLVKLKNELEGKCIKEGYIKKGSVEIIKRSIGVVDSIHFNGRICYNVTFSADICNPAEGFKLQGTIVEINKMGALVIEEPLSIVIPKQHHTDLNVFKGLEVGSKIFINIIGTKFELYDTEIDAVGVIFEKK
jgi:DNA-directed RNA polymerase subunit E'/Rpb7